MTALEAHYAAILHDTADDLVRPSFADHLEEHGYALRGEFVRGGVELARIKVFRGENGESVASNDASRFRRLRSRAAALLGVGRGLGWFGVPGMEFHGVSPDGELLYRCPPSNPAELLPLMRATVSRGFVAAITCPSVAAFEACAASVFRTHPCEKVTITGATPWTGATLSSWYDEERRDAAGHPASNLPKPIYDALEGRDEAGGKFYPTALDALQTLSTACIAHGRALAGLPAAHAAT